MKVWVVYACDKFNRAALNILGVFSSREKAVAAIDNQEGPRTVYCYREFTLDASE